MAASRASQTVRFCWEGPAGAGRVTVPAAYAEELMRAFAQGSPRPQIWVEQAGEDTKERGERRLKWRAQ